jgi:hypothetical protein
MLPARAETRSFPEYGFSIEMPEWWEPVSDNPPGTVFAMHGPKKDRTVFVVLTRVRPAEAGTTLAGVIVDVRKQLEQSGLAIKGEGHVQSNDIEWTTIDASGNNTDSTLWIDLTPDKLYLLRADNIAGGKVAGDAEVQATLRSFRFIPMTGESQQSENEKEARADALAFVLCGVVVVIGAGLAVFLAIRPAGRKKK